MEVLPEFPLEYIADFIQGRTVATDAFNAADLLARDATGNDQVIEAQVRRHIQSQTMVTHPTAHGDAQRCQFHIPGPDSCQPFYAACMDIPFMQGTDQHLFQPVHQVSHTEAVYAQIDYRVAHKLTRSVVGDVTTSLDFLPAHPELRQALPVNDQVSAVTTAA